MERDLAVVVKEAVTHAELMAAVHSAATQGWLKNTVLFDVYRPKKGAESTGGLAADFHFLKDKIKATIEAFDWDSNSTAVRRNAHLKARAL